MKLILRNGFRDRAVCNNVEHVVINNPDILIDLIKKACQSVKNEQYNSKFGDDKLCKCGHTYYRHFDSYDDMYPIGCKYCKCRRFKL